MIMKQEINSNLLAEIPGNQRRDKAICLCPV